MNKAVQSEATVHQAIRSMKNALMTYKYQALPAITTIFSAQVGRIEANFVTAEAAIKAGNPAYTVQGLAQQWNIWSRGYTDLVIARYETFFNTWLPKIEKVLENTDPTQDDAARATLRTKITLLRAEVNAVRGTWNNPL